MVSLAFWIVTLSVVLGAALAFLFLRPVWSAPPLVGATHGILGTFGLAVLALALKSGANPAAHGMAAFEKYAAILFAGAWLIGLVIAFLPLQTRRSIGFLIAVHATVALFGYVILLAYWALG